MGLIEDVGGEPRLKNFGSEHNQPPVQKSDPDLVIPDEGNDDSYDTPAFLRHRAGR
jgi:hypothetical protein